MAITKEIRTALSDEDRARLGNEISEHVLRCAKIEEKKRLVTADLTNEAKAEKKAYREKSKALLDGFSYKEVECELVHDFDRNTVFTKRIDTGETVGERAMSSEERQQKIAFPEDGDEAGGDEPRNDAPVIEIADGAKKRSKTKVSTGFGDKVAPLTAVADPYKANEKLGLDPKPEPH